MGRILIDTNNIDDEMPKGEKSRRNRCGGCVYKRVKCSDLSRV